MEDFNRKGVRAWLLTGNPAALERTLGEQACLANASAEELLGFLGKLIEIWVLPTDGRHKPRKPEINRAVATLEKGTTIHAHMLVASRNEINYENLKNKFPGWHIEPMKGAYSQALDYMYKRKEYSGKASTRLAGPIEWGSFEPNEKARPEKLYEVIQGYVADGLTPSQIYLMDPRMAMHTKMVESYYSAFIQKNIRPVRPVHVTWAFGPSGSGKSYGYVKWCEQYGSERVYFGSCATKNVFDGLEESRHTHLVLDELRENTFRYSELLQILDVFPARLAARFRDRTATYSDVLITTPLSPEAYYAGVSKSADDGETMEQLLRRIDVVKYCFLDPRRSGTERYRSIAVSTKDYRGAEWIAGLADKELQSEVAGLVR